jgi:hypothetical protein
MFVNGKMRPAETIPGMRGGRIRENDEGGKFKYIIFYIFIVQTFVNIVMYPHHNDNFKKFIYTLEFICNLNTST